MGMQLGSLSQYMMPYVSPFKITIQRVAPSTLIKKVVLHPPTQGHTVGAVLQCVADMRMVCVPLRPLDKLHHLFCRSTFKGNQGSFPASFKRHPNRKPILNFKPAQKVKFQCPQSGRLQPPPQTEGSTPSGLSGRCHLPVPGGSFGRRRRSRGRRRLPGQPEPDVGRKASAMPH